MKVGVVFPQIEMPADPGAVKEYAQAAEGLGYSHLLVYDHVLGADLTNRPDWKGAYHAGNPFHEVFVLFGYLAGITSKVELVSGVIILPQRQTALVAKQAAEIDVLSEGRLRLGVGIGWNDVEYTALNENFRNRGRRFEEQIELLRKLFNEPSVDFQGKYHTIPEAGLNPLPVQRPIPIWIGGRSQPALERAGRIADGWFPQLPPGPGLDEFIGWVNAGAESVGRDPSTIQMEGRYSLAGTNPEDWQDVVDTWRKLGAAYLSINTMGMGLSPEGHIETIRRFKEVVG